MFILDGGGPSQHDAWKFYLEYFSFKVE
jgi:hypothetical protein